jgi:hypothetical protein
MKKLWIVVALLAVAFLGGYVPERLKRREVEGLATQTRATLEEERSRVRLGAVLGRALALRDSVAAQNYGIAKSMSTQFFDAAREEAARTGDPATRAALEDVGRMRDTLTSALTAGDPTSAEMVRGLELKLRGALGYERPADAPAPAAPAAPAAPTAAN